VRVPLRAAVVLGRGRGVGLRLPDDQVSRRHARVRRRGGRVLVEDLGSKNGLRVNGVRVEQRPVTLAPGDELALGETAVGLEDPTFAPAAPPAVPRPPRPAARLRPLAAAALLFAHSAAALLLAAT
jgi:pSer/pThr/pTyr-binding forkhead associated (FHA) protein